MNAAIFPMAWSVLEIRENCGETRSEHVTNGLGGIVLLKNSKYIHKNKQKNLRNMQAHSKTFLLKHLFPQKAESVSFPIPLMADLTGAACLSPSIARAVSIKKKNTATRQIRQIHWEWTEKPGFSCDSIRSAASRQKARGATQRFRSRHICPAHDPAARDGRARPRVLPEKISHSAGERKDTRDETDAMPCGRRADERLGNQSAAAFSAFDLGRLCLACAWLRHERVQR